MKVTTGDVVSIEFDPLLAYRCVALEKNAAVYTFMHRCKTYIGPVKLCFATLLRPALL
jgi:hypothetical protein